MSNKTALIVGATGLVGGHLLQYLLNSDRYNNVIAIVRKSSLAPQNKLTELVVDFDALDNYSAQMKADEVFCCLGTTIKTAGTKDAFKLVDYTYPLEVARICLEQGATQYLLVSSLGADAKSRVFYSRTKGEVERDLKKLPFETIHILQPSMLLGNRHEVRLGEKVGEVLLGAFKFLLNGPAKKYRAIEAKAVAFAMMLLAQTPSIGNHTHISEELQVIFDKNSSLFESSH